MKKTLAILLIFILTISLVGCCNINQNNEDFASINNETSNEETNNRNSNETTPKINDSVFPQSTAFGLDNINYSSLKIVAYISSVHDYWFSHHNEDFFKKIKEFSNSIKSRNMTLTETPPDTQEFNFFVSIYDESLIKGCTFIVYHSDHIKFFNESGSYSECYYSEGVYKEFIESFKPFFEENEKYCKTGETPVLRLYEYVIIDNELNVLEVDTISEQPHIIYHSGIVHFWYQAGTGGLSRLTKFFDVEKGLTSPQYYGQTDFFENFVCCAESSKVVIYDMFSKEELFCIDSFEKKLGDNMENIRSAYFSNDGKKITVTYLNTDYGEEIQIFEVPETLKN